MVVDSPARSRFAALLEREPIPLDEAALAIAAEDTPDLRPEDYLERLDALADRVRVRTPSGPASILRAIREVLHVEEGFQGNTKDYYDPRNSFLSQVIDRRLGIPITLSVVWLEVARRMGLKLEGVGFPGHFLVKYVGGHAVEVFVDAFQGGEILSADECAARFRARFGRDLDRRFLDGVGTRQILARLLHNLSKIYRDRKDAVGSWWVADRLLLLTPGDLNALRARGTAAADLGATGAACSDLEAWLANASPTTETSKVEEQLASLRRNGPLAN